MTTTPVRSERRTVRAIYRLLVWLFLATIVVQVYLAGYGFFGGDFDMHAMWGFTGVHGAALLMMVVGFFARLGRNLVLVNIGTFVLAFLMPMLATTSVTAVAALHPIAALAVFTAAIYLAWRARGFTFSQPATGAAARASA